MSQWNHEFPLDDSLCYLNHAAVSPWPQRTADAVQQFAGENLHTGSLRYPHWLGIELRLRQRLARLINAASVDDIALVKNTSEALSFVAFGLDWRAGDQIIISAEEFPSNRIVWEALKGQGVEVIEVDVMNPTPEKCLLDAISPRTRLMAISAVQYASGLVMDLPQLAAGCHAKGVLLCVDAIQHLGARPYDVQAIDADFTMADGHKWMLGPEGLGVLHMKPALRDQLKLHEYGWHMVEDVGNYDRKDWEVASSARRFECGSPNMLGTVALEASLSLLEEVGIEQVAAHIRTRMELLVDLLRAQPGIQLLGCPDPNRRAGILTFRPEGSDLPSLFRELNKAGVFCAQRGGGIRFSPHFYTPDERLEKAVGILASLR